MLLAPCQGKTLSFSAQRVACKSTSQNSGQGQCSTLRTATYYNVLQSSGRQSTASTVDVKAKLGFYERSKQRTNLHSSTSSPPKTTQAAVRVHDGFYCIFEDLQRRPALQRSLAMSGDFNSFQQLGSDHSGPHSRRKSAVSLLSRSTDKVFPLPSCIEVSLDRLSGFLSLQAHSLPK